MTPAGSFEFACPTPGCGHRYRVTPELVGKTILCKSCKQKVRLPATSNLPAGSSSAHLSKSGSGTARTHAVAARHVSVPSAEAPSSSAPRRPAPTAPPPTVKPGTDEVTCPHCRSVCRIRPEWRGTTLQCPACQKRFVATQTRPSPLPSRAAAHAESQSEPAFVTEDDDAAKDFMPTDDYGFDEEPAATPLLQAGDESESFASPRRSTRKKRSRGGPAALDWLADQRQWLLPLSGVGMAVVAIVYAFLRLKTVASAGGAYMAEFVVGTMIGVAIALSIAVLLLWLGCRVCSVDRPGFAEAMGIICLNAVVQSILGFLLGLAVGTPGESGVTATQIVGAIVQIPTGMLISAVIYSAMLETSFVKGILIWLVQFAVIVVIVLVLVIVVVAAGVALVAGGAGKNSPNAPPPAFPLGPTAPPINMGPLAAPAGTGGSSQHEAVFKDLLAVLNEEADIMSRITDQASAKEAEPKLNSLQGRFQAIQTRALGLPNPSPLEDQRLKQQYEAPLQAAFQRIQQESSRIKSLALGVTLPSPPSLPGLGGGQGSPGAPPRNGRVRGT